MSLWRGDSWGQEPYSINLSIHSTQHRGDAKKKYLTKLLEILLNLAIMRSSVTKKWWGGRQWKVDVWHYNFRMGVFPEQLGRKLTLALYSALTIIKNHVFLIHSDIIVIEACATLSFKAIKYH